MAGSQESKRNVFRHNLNIYSTELIIQAQPSVLWTPGIWGPVFLAGFSWQWTVSAYLPVFPFDWLEELHFGMIDTVHLTLAFTFPWTGAVLMIDQTSPPFSTHVKHCKRLAPWLGERFCSNPFKLQLACRVAWKLLMKRQQILGFYGLENSTNQSALLTVYLFRAFLFSKPSNAHLFHAAFSFGSLHIDFPVQWYALMKLEHSA